MGNVCVRPCVDPKWPGARLDSTALCTSPCHRQFYLHRCRYTSDAV